MSMYEGRVPDPTLCQAPKSDSGTRFPHTYQCGRAGKHDVNGVLLCTQHAKRARTFGSTPIVTAPLNWSGWSVRNHIVDKDPELVAERKRKDDEALQRWRERNGFTALDKAREQLTAANARIDRLAAVVRAVKDGDEKAMYAAIDRLGDGDV